MLWIITLLGFYCIFVGYNRFENNLKHRNKKYVYPSNIKYDLAHQYTNKLVDNSWNEMVKGRSYKIQDDKYYSIHS